MSAGVNVPLAAQVFRYYAGLDAAVAGNVRSAMFNTGQACGAYTRFYVDARRADEFVEKAAAGLRVGRG